MTGDLQREKGYRRAENTSYFVPPAGTHLSAPRRNTVIALKPMVCVCSAVRPALGGSIEQTVGQTQGQEFPLFKRGAFSGDLSLLSPCGDTILYYRKYSTTSLLLLQLHNVLYSRQVQIDR